MRSSAETDLSEKKLDVRSAAEVLVASLVGHGIDTIFGQSIPSTIHLSGPDAGLRSVTYRTENAGAAMADGYARVAGKVGVVTAQNGPAATLLVPGLAEALTASVPVVALVQEIPAAHRDKNAFQELDHIALFQGCTKWIRRIDDPKRIDDYIEMAVRTASSGRPGPTVLLCPTDVLDTKVKVSPHKGGKEGGYPLDRPTASIAAVNEAAELLAHAERPLIYAGGGVHLSDASAVLADLQESCHLPVATTTMGKGVVSENHPLSIGCIGYYMGHNSATEHHRSIVQQADIILIVGNRTNQNGTDSWTLLPQEAKYIHIDIDPLEIGRNYPALRLCGDARATLSAILDRLKLMDLSKRAAYRPQIESAIARGKNLFSESSASISRSEALPIRPERIMADLGRILPPNAIVTADASYSSVWVANCLRANTRGMRFITPRGMAGLGWGLPLAIGAAVARPDASIVCIVGDGGFAHCWSELETLKRHNIKVVILVLNNGVLGFQKHAELARYGKHTDAVEFAPVDHAAIARACNINGVSIRNPSEIAPAIAAALAAEVSTVVDIATDPDAYPPISWFDRAPFNVLNGRSKA